MGPPHDGTPQIRTSSDIDATGYCIFLEVRVLALAIEVLQVGVLVFDCQAERSHFSMHFLCNVAAGEKRSGNESMRMNIAQHRDSCDGW